MKKDHKMKPLTSFKNTSQKSGRCNTTDIVTAIPECRLGNEGYYGRRKVAFDDLTLPEWATGQLSNKLQIQDQSTAKMHFVS